jgi:hypothetical protein
MDSKNLPKGRDRELVIQELEDEVLIFDLNTNKAYSLNDTSSAIWSLCDGHSSVSDIARKLSAKLNRPVAEEFVWLALDQFKKDDLLSNGKEIEIDFNGLSRREVIRKIGFTSMIALPVIGSLVAPTAAMAASGAVGCGTVGQGCSGSGVGTCCMGTAYCMGSTCAVCISPGVGVGPCVVNGPSCPSVNTQCCSGAASLGSCGAPLVAGQVVIFAVNPPPIGTPQQCRCS